MTQPTNTYATNDMVGIREDLEEVIYNISPLETPFVSMMPQIEADNTVHEWQTESLSDAANNAAIEGDDAPQDAGTPTVRINNRTQISTKDATVSGTARAVNTAGRADELDHQMLLRARELKRDMETGLLSNKAKVTGDDSTANEYAGITSWIATNTSAVGADPTGDGSDTATDGAQRALTEDLMKTVLASIWDQGGMPTVAMTGSFNRRKISEFTGNSTSMQKAEDKVLHATFDVYEGDFSRLKIVPNRFTRARDLLLLDMDYWSIAFLPGRNMISFPLAKTGDTDKRQILSEYTLVAKQEAASGILRDLTTS